MTLTPGQTIGAYRIVEQLGRGGMATVYKAHQAALARYVAVKVLPAYLAEDPTFRERFQAEAVTIAKLRHPNILQVFDFGEEAGLHYIVTEFVDGGTLAEQLGKPLPDDYVVKVLTPIASALDYAHAREVLHRDIKPANVLLARDGTPVVSDFGLARMMGSIERLTRTGAVVGTPEYMAPEQAAGENAGPAADRYALAIVAYEMLVGNVPYSADTPLATLIAHLHKPLPLPSARNPQLSPALEAALLKGLAKSPDDRYPTAVAFVRALAEAAGGAPTQQLAAAAPLATAPAPTPAAAVASVPTAVAAPAPRRMRTRTVAIAAAVITVALAVAAVLALTLGAPTDLLSVSATLESAEMEVVAPPPADGGPPARSVRLTVNFSNTSDATLSNVEVVVHSVPSLSTTGGRPDKTEDGALVYRQPDLPPRGRATFQLGVYALAAGTFELPVSVRAKGVPEVWDSVMLTGVAAAATPPSAVPKGQLVWQAALDGTMSELSPPQMTGDAVDTAIRTPPGALELEMLKAGSSSASAGFRRELPSAFVAEILFKVRPRSDNVMRFVIRSDGMRQHLVQVNVGSELLEFAYIDNSKQPRSYEALSGRVAVPGLQSGRPVGLSVVAHANGYAVYLDGQPVIPQVTDDRLAAFSSLSFATFGNPGLVTISSLRVYTYLGTEAAAASPPAGAAAAPSGECVPAVGGSNVTRECRFTGLPPGAAATFAITHDDRPMQAPPGAMTVEGDGSVTFRMGPGILGRFTVTATAGGVSRTLRFVAR